jgi:hypothetical protein
VPSVANLAELVLKFHPLGVDDEICRGRRRDHVMEDHKLVVGQIDGASGGTLLRTRQRDLEVDLEAARQLTTVDLE